MSVRETISFLIVFLSFGNSSPHRKAYINHFDCHPDVLKSKGRYICTRTGEKVCLQGWSDPHNDCLIPVCNFEHYLTEDTINKKVSSCVNGRCIAPNVCACHVGWEGQRCDKCITSKSCVHGSCLDNPFECICHNKTRWTGEHCEKPICKPGCMNGNCKQPGECICLRGWSGTYCDKCETHSLCEHGTCKSPGECSCKNGWMGQNCDCPKCKEGCNLRNGYCTKPDECLCDVGWQGETCDQCIAHPKCPKFPNNCKGPWDCICPKGVNESICLAGERHLEQFVFPSLLSSNCRQLNRLHKDQETKVPSQQGSRPVTKSPIKSTTKLVTHKQPSSTPVHKVSPTSTSKTSKSTKITSKKVSKVTKKSIDSSMAASKTSLSTLSSSKGSTSTQSVSSTSSIPSNGFSTTLSTDSVDIGQKIKPFPSSTTFKSDDRNTSYSQKLSTQLPPSTSSFATEIPEPQSTIEDTEATDKWDEHVTKIEGNNLTSSTKVVQTDKPFESSNSTRIYRSDNESTIIPKASSGLTQDNLITERQPTSVESAKTSFTSTIGEDLIDKYSKTTSSASKVEETSEQPVSSSDNIKTSKVTTGTDFLNQTSSYETILRSSTEMSDNFDKSSRPNKTIADGQFQETSKKLSSEDKKSTPQESSTTQYEISSTSTSDSLKSSTSKVHTESQYKDKVGYTSYTSTALVTDNDRRTTTASFKQPTSNEDNSTSVSSYSTPKQLKTESISNRVDTTSKVSSSDGTSKQRITDFTPIVTSDYSTGSSDGSTKLTPNQVSEVSLTEKDAQRLKTTLTDEDLKLRSTQTAKSSNRDSESDKETLFTPKATTSFETSLLNTSKKASETSQKESSTTSISTSVGFFSNGTLLKGNSEINITILPTTSSEHGRNTSTEESTISQPSSIQTNNHTTKSDILNFFSTTDASRNHPDYGDEQPVSTPKNEKSSVTATSLNQVSDVGVDITQPQTFEKNEGHGFIRSSTPNFHEPVVSTILINTTFKESSSSTTLPFIGRSHSTEVTTSSETEGSLSTIESVTNSERPLKVQSTQFKTNNPFQAKESKSTQASPEVTFKPSDISSFSSNSNINTTLTSTEAIGITTLVNEDSFTEETTLTENNEVPSTSQATSAIFPNQTSTANSEDTHSQKSTASTDTPPKRLSSTLKIPTSSTEMKDSSNETTSNKGEEATKATDSGLAESGGTISKSSQLSTIPKTDNLSTRSELATGTSSLQTKIWTPSSTFSSVISNKNESNGTINNQNDEASPVPTSDQGKSATTRHTSVENEHSFPTLKTYYLKPNDTITSGNERDENSTEEILNIPKHPTSNFSSPDFSSDLNSTFTEKTMSTSSDSNKLTDFTTLMQQTVSGTFTPSDINITKNSTSNISAVNDGQIILVTKDKESSTTNFQKTLIQSESTLLDFSTSFPLQSSQKEVFNNKSGIQTTVTGDPQTSLFSEKQSISTSGSEYKDISATKISQNYSSIENITHQPNLLETSSSNYLENSTLNPKNLEFSTSVNPHNKSTSEKEYESTNLINLETKLSSLSIPSTVIRKGGPDSVSSLPVEPGVTGPASANNSSSSVTFQPSQLVEITSSGTDNQKPGSEVRPPLNRSVQTTETSSNHTTNMASTSTLSYNEGNITLIDTVLPHIDFAEDLGLNFSSTSSGWKKNPKTTFSKYSTKSTKPNHYLHVTNGTKYPENKSTVPSIHFSSRESDNITKPSETHTSFVTNQEKPILGSTLSTNLTPEIVSKDDGEEPRRSTTSIPINFASSATFLFKISQETHDTTVEIQKSSSKIPTEIVTKIKEKIDSSTFNTTLNKNETSTEGEKYSTKKGEHDTEDKSSTMSRISDKSTTNLKAKEDHEEFASTSDSNFVSTNRFNSSLSPLLENSTISLLNETFEESKSFRPSDNLHSSSFPQASSSSPMSLNDTSLSKEIEGPQTESKSVQASTGQSTDLGLATSATYSGQSNSSSTSTQLPKTFSSTTNYTQATNYSLNSSAPVDQESSKGNSSSSSTTIKALQEIPSSFQSSIPFENLTSSTERFEKINENSSTTKASESSSSSSPSSSQGQESANQSTSPTPTKLKLPSDASTKYQSTTITDNLSNSSTEFEYLSGKYNLKENVSTTHPNTTSTKMLSLSTSSSIPSISSSEQFELLTSSTQLGNSSQAFDSIPTTSSTSPPTTSTSTTSSTSPPTTSTSTTSSTSAPSTSTSTTSSTSPPTTSISITSSTSAPTTSTLPPISSSSPPTTSTSPPTSSTSPPTTSTSPPTTSTSTTSSTSPPSTSTSTTSSTSAPTTSTLPSTTSTSTTSSTSPPTTSTPTTSSTSAPTTSTSAPTPSTSTTSSTSPPTTSTASTTTTTTTLSTSSSTTTTKSTSRPTESYIDWFKDQFDPIIMKNPFTEKSKITKSIFDLDSFDFHQFKTTAKKAPLPTVGNPINVLNPIYKPTAAQKTYFPQTANWIFK